MLPSCPLPPASLVKLSMPLFEEEEREVIPTFAFAYDFFFFFHSLLWSQRRLVTRASRRRAEPRCKAPFQLRENLLWIKPRPQSGLVLISPLCVQSD